MKKTVAGFLLLIIPAALYAYEFGLLFNNYAGFGNAAGENKFEYAGSLIPRFSMPVGEAGDFLTSASVTLGYDKEIYFYPELMRTELSFRFGAMGLKLGRFGYADPSALIAQGLFDGLQLAYGSGAGRFAVGAWYTGLVFKKTANIIMTEDDLARFGTPLDYSDFLNTYFAPRRVIAALDWEHPSLGELMGLNLSLLGQFDLTDGEEKINTQYFVLKARIPFGGFVIEAGGSLQTSQYEAEDESAFKLAFAGNLGFNWTLPASFNSRLSFSGGYTSGNMNESTGAFSPVTTKYAGEIFKTKVTALSIFKLDYSARFHKALGASFAVSYFVRNDLVTGIYPINGEEKREFFLGPEFFGKLVWSPASDLQLNLGGGVFIPALGNVWTETGTQWRIDLSVNLALF